MFGQFVFLFFTIGLRLSIEKLDQWEDNFVSYLLWQIIALKTICFILIFFNSQMLSNIIKWVKIKFTKENFQSTMYPSSVCEIRAWDNLNCNSILSWTKLIISIDCLSHFLFFFVVLRLNLDYLSVFVEIPIYQIKWNI